MHSSQTLLERGSVGSNSNVNLSLSTQITLFLDVNDIKHNTNKSNIFAVLLFSNYSFIVSSFPTNSPKLSETVTHSLSLSHVKVHLPCNPIPTIFIKSIHAAKIYYTAEI